MLNFFNVKFQKIHNNLSLIPGKCPDEQIQGITLFDGLKYKGYAVLIIN